MCTFSQTRSQTLSQSKTQITAAENPIYEDTNLAVIPEGGDALGQDCFLTEQIAFNQAPDNLAAVFLKANWNIEGRRGVPGKRI